MERIVYIIGAGFSAPLGLPVMSNFLIKSKDLYYNDTAQYKHFKLVFDTIKEMSITKNYYDADLLNIEEILSILEIQQNLTGSRIKKSFVKYIIDVVNHYTPEFNKTSELPGNWSDFIFCTSTLEKYYGFFVANLFHLQFEKKIVNDYGVQKTEFHCKRDSNSDSIYSIISLNYDLIFEKVTEYLNQNFKVEKEISFSRTSLIHPFVDHPHLSKLHGSADLGVIIPPTWNKTLNKKIVYNWKNAYDLLIAANQIRILGYSLPVSDTYVKYLLKAAVIKSPHLKKVDIINLDDEKGSIKKRYDDFIKYKNYRFKKADITDYLKHIHDLYKKSLDHNREEAKINQLEKAHEDFFSNL